MAINKNGTGYTFGFAIVMVVVVGAALAATAISLKPLQQANAADKKMMDILGAIKVDSQRDNAKELFVKHVTSRAAIDTSGQVVTMRMDKDGKSLEKSLKDATDPFNIDIKKDYRSHKPAKGDLAWGNADNLNFPVFECQKEGETYFVVPMVGSGLWGPIWGYVALEDDMQTIYGAKFDHKTETPGLGAEIRESSFTTQFEGQKLRNEGPNYFSVLKAGAPRVDEQKDYIVDGITGGTITSKGVDEMLNRTMGIYLKYFKKEQRAQR